MNKVMDGQVNLFDQDTWYGRTFPAHCQAMEETTLRQSSKKSSKSQSRKRPIFKCLNMAGQRGGGYRDVGGRWSVAYRVHDAQWYGVPQRRRRISVVADFGGSTAHEILFEQCSVSGNPTESGAQGKRPAGAVKSGSYPAVARSLTARYDGSPCVDRGPNIICEPLNQSCLTAWDCQSKRIFDTNGVSPTLQGGVGGGVNNPALFCANPWDAQSARLYDADGIYASLNANSGGGKGALVQTEKSGTLGTGNDQTVISFTQNQRDEVRDLKDKAGSLSAQPGMKQQTYILDGRAEAAVQTVVIPINDKATRYEGGGDTRKNDGAGNGLGVGKKESGGSSLNLNNVCRTSGTARRLTPLECTRLQGFPDGWVDIGEWTDEKGRVHKEADAPKYKALGNSIALPFWKWLLRRISEYLPEGATLGSLFDGIGGFPLCWAEIHGAENCRWASEIEQFPIAVVKRHFGDEDAGIFGDVDKFLKGETVC